MFDLASIILTAGAGVGLAALLSTDPVSVQKTYVPTLVEYQGYQGELISKLLRERIRTIAREANTARGDQLGVFNADESAIDILAQRLHIDGLIDSMREFFGMQHYTISPSLVHSKEGFRFNFAEGQLVYSTNDLKMSIKGETADGKLFVVTVTGRDSIPALIDGLAERFIERVDPYVLALYYFRKEEGAGKFTDTLSMIEHCVRVLPSSQKVWPLVLWGDVYFRQGHYDQAILKYREALAINPRHSEAQALWGNALIAQGNIKEGLATLHAAADMAAGDSNQLKETGWPTVHTHLGDALANLGQDEEAREAYMEGLKLVPDNPYLKTGLGVLYLRHGQLDVAIELIQAALKNHPAKAEPRKWLDQALAAKYKENL